MEIIAKLVNALNKDILSLNMANKEQKTARQCYARLWRDWLKPYRSAFGLALLLMVITGIAAASYAKVIELIIAAFESNSTSVFWWGPLLAIAFTSLKGVAQFISEIIQARILSRVQANLQSSLFRKLVSMDLSHLLAEAPAALAARFSADIDVIRLALVQVFNSVRALFTVLAAFAVMLSIDWVMTLGLIVIFAVAIGPVSVIGSRVRKLTNETQQEVADMTATVNESLSGIRMVRTYQLEKRLVESSRSTFERLFGLRVRIAQWQAAVSPLMEILGGLAIAAMLSLVAIRLSTGHIELAGFVGILMALAIASNPARELGVAYTAALSGQAALDRIFDVLDQKNTITDGRYIPDKTHRVKGEIAFEKVNFIYPDGYQALHDVNLRIEAGQKIAFVGRSGAGKTTVFNLLPRLFDASDGVIKIDETPIVDYTLAALRQQISVVSQDAVQLSGTVLENISFGRSDADRATCITAAKAAAAHEFIIKLSDGYDTEIDPAHMSFSGGERQRLSIARAILRDAPILLLDEPTSALDAESEAAIKAALDRLSKDRTTLIIAHRLSTIMDADMIVVMDKGRVADKGTHDELLARGGIYAELYNLQFDQTTRQPRVLRSQTQLSPRGFIRRMFGV